MATEIGIQAQKLRKRFSGDFNAGYASAALAGLIGTLIASGIVEWMLPFVYNVGFSGFRFSVFIWVFLGGLVILDKLSLSQEDESVAKEASIERR
jgi:uncharacterized membrane protein YeaQ/YmgE (transglycosylase-associated protein family)